MKLIYVLLIALSIEPSAFAAKARWKAKRGPIVHHHNRLHMPLGWKRDQKFSGPLSVVPVLPPLFDWRNEKLAFPFPPVKDQKSCGDCWAFAAQGVVQLSLLVKKGIAVSLSEQQMLSCNRQGYSCDGGWLDAVSFAVSNGATSDANFPYVALRGPCKRGLPSIAKASGWKYVGNSDGTVTENDIKQAIFTYGPVTTAIGANADMERYQSGVFNSCDSTPLNHAVVLVGWNDVDKYWIVRNSWGEAYGEHGYVRVAYGCNQVATTASYVTFE